MNSLCLRIQEEQDYNNFAALLREMSELIERKERRRFKDRPKLVRQRTLPWMRVPAVVRRIVKPRYPAEREKVEIIFDAADELFRELRVENRFTGLDGGLVALRDGTQLEVTFEAEIAERSTN